MKIWIDAGKLGEESKSKHARKRKHTIKNAEKLTIVPSNNEDKK